MQYLKHHKKDQSDYPHNLKLRFKITADRIAEIVCDKMPGIFERFRHYAGNGIHQLILLCNDKIGSKYGYNELQKEISNIFYISARIRECRKTDGPHQFRRIFRDRFIHVSKNFLDALRKLY